MEVLQSVWEFLIPANSLSVISLIILIGVYAWGLFLRNKSLSNHKKQIEEKIEDFKRYYASAPPEVFIKLIERELGSSFSLKAVPSTLVSIGVMATFIGLGLAIMDASIIINEDATPDPSQLLNVLSIISFKFQTSVYGIFLSIIFSFVVIKPYIRKIEEIEENKALELYEGRHSLQQVFDSLNELVSSFNNSNDKLVNTLNNLDTGIKERAEESKEQNKKINFTLDKGLKQLSNSTNNLDESLKNILDNTTKELLKVTKDSTELQKNLDESISEGLESINKSVNKMDTSLGKIQKEMGNEIGKSLESLKDAVKEMKESVIESQDESGKIIEQMGTAITRQNEINTEFKEVMEDVSKNIDVLAKSTGEIVLLSKQDNNVNTSDLGNPMDGIK